MGQVRPAGPAAVIDVETAGDVTLLSVAGLADERFAGFGLVRPAAQIALHVSRLTRVASFGVRRWLEAMNALPESLTDLYLVGCPTFFVDQLNMVLNFGGTAKVLSVAAPYACPACGEQSSPILDVLAERAQLLKGCAPDQ